jgi:hypothetical protein
MRTRRRGQPSPSDDGETAERVVRRRTAARRVYQFAMRARIRAIMQEMERTATEGLFGLKTTITFPGSSAAAKRLKQALHDEILRALEDTYSGRFEMWARLAKGETVAKAMHLQTVTIWLSWMPD